MLATGGSTNAVVRLTDLELPGFPMRLEAMALEPVRPVVRPAIAFIDSLCYLTQTARGEIVGGAEVPERPHNSLQADLPAMAATARVSTTIDSAARTSSISGANDSIRRSWRYTG